MENLLESLHQFCQKFGREEKILLVPSHFAGWQITDRYVQKYGGWINLHTKTISDLVDEILSPVILQRNLKFATNFHSLAYTASACNEQISDEGYFGELKSRRGFHHAMVRTIGDVFASGTMNQLRRNSKNNKKLTELYNVAIHYRKSLDDASLLMPEEKLTYALQIISEPSESRKSKRNIAILNELNLSKLELKLLSYLTHDNTWILPREDYEINLQSLDVSMFQADGEENEIRHVFRTLINRQIPFDTVELLYSDSSYLPLIQQLSTEYEIPTTFSGGIPLSASHIGQAALGFLGWLRDNYSVIELYRLLNMSCIRLPGESGVGGFFVARTIRSSRIGQGLTRYRQQIENWNRTIANSEIKKDEEGNEIDNKRRSRHLQASVDCLNELLTLIPAQNNRSYNFSDVTKSLSQFLSNFTTAINEPDRQAGEVLSRLLMQIENLPELHLSANEAISELVESIQGLHWGAELPKPGKLHVSHYRTGGYSGRRYTFLIGMDEQRFPGGSLLDPILLDTERKRINEDNPQLPLTIGSDRTAEVEQDFEQLINRLSGTLIVGFSCYDLIENREKYPSTKLLLLYRLLNKEHTASFDVLEESLGEPVGFISENGLSASSSEHWLREASLHDKKFVSAVLQHFPRLKSGEEARRARLSFDFTEFDGWIRNPEQSFDPRMTQEPVSATRLARLAKCSYAYFLQYILNVEPAEELERDPLQWLDPLEYGRVLHTVFHRLMLEISNRNEVPSRIKHETLANRIVGEEIAAEVTHNQPMLDINIEDTRNKLLHSCSIFLQSEAVRFERFEPIFFELPFGIDKFESTQGLDSKEPTSLHLFNQQKLQLRGIIDRINRVRSEKDSYEIVDYKSGSDKPFSSKSPFNQGRQLQHGLYALAWEELLRRNGIEGKVVQSGYFFPSKRSAGKWLTYPFTEANQAKLIEIVDELCEILNNGSFLRTTDSNDCKFCEYKTICGNVDVVCDAAKQKLDNNTPQLLPISRLHNCE